MKAPATSEGLCGKPTLFSEEGVSSEKQGISLVRYISSTGHERYMLLPNKQTRYYYRENPLFRQHD
jgi:hypothetical protein